MKTIENIKNIYDYFKSLGYTPVDSSNYEKMEKWNSYYVGDVNEFHSYSQYNGVKMVKRKRKTLNMAKKICEDKADLIFNEKVEINLTHKDTKAFVDEVLFENDFFTLANKLVEKSNALGTAAFVEMFFDDRIVIDGVSGRNIYPLSYDGDKIIECAFAGERYFNGEKHIYINIHIIEEGEYVIYNTALKQEGAHLVEVNIPQKYGVAKRFETGSKKPFFQIVKPNVVNNASLSSPFGISSFAGALDILQGIDIVYDSFINEFELGKKRIFIDSSLVQISMGEDGAKLSPVFDNNDICFYGLSGLRENGELIKEVNMELRTKEHIDAININLSLLSSKCGLGDKFYSFEKTGLKTATEIISENADLYRKIRKDKILLEKAIIDLVKNIIFMGNAFLDGDFTEEGLTIDFDDSIIEDKQTICKTAMEERQLGLINDAEYFRKTRNMDYEGAKIFASEMRGETSE